jgi:putative ABC transport system permease protein
VEALLLSSLGGLIGLGIGQLGSWGIRAAFPQMEAYPPNWAIFASMLVAIVTGALFSLLPARTAARLDPVMALSRH